MKLSDVIVNFLKKHIFLDIFSVIIILLDVAATLIPPIILQYIVDTVIASQDLNKLLIWAIIYASSYLVYGGLEFLKSFMLIKVSQSICKDIRIGLLDKVHIMSYEDLSSYDIGTIESLFNNDVNTINTLVSDGVISMAIDLFKMLGVFVSIFIFSVNIGYLVLAVFPFILVFALFARKRMYQSKLKVKQMESDVNQRVLENIDNIESVQTYEAYGFVSDYYDKILRTHFDAQKVSMFYDSIFSPVMQLLRYSLIATIIMVSTVNPSVFGITIGTFLSVSDLLSDLFTPMENIGMELQTLQESTASIHRINQFMDKGKPIDYANLVDLNDSSYKLDFSSVYYSYQKDERVIDDFSYYLNQGDKLTLKGDSGVGKSTLFKLGYGLLIPNKGRVTLNNVDVQKVSSATRRKVFGIVYQDSFFSNGTIREELSLGDSSIKDDDIYEVLHEIGLGRIEDINKKFNEKDYSSGELALFNIGRVLLRHPYIIFLDEMNAKIDPSTAMKIINMLNDKAASSTVLSITHYGTQLNNSKELILKAK